MTEEKQYWFLAQGAGTDNDAAVRAFSIPWWPEAIKWAHREGDERVDAPMLFSRQEAAEAEARRLSEPDPDGYLSLVSEVGEEEANRILAKSLPLRAYDLGQEMLAMKLEDCEFLCVMVDGRIKLRRDFLAELITEEV